MDLKYLQKIIKMLDTSNLAEIQIEEEGTKLRLSKPRVIAGIQPQTIMPQIQQIQTEPAILKESAKDVKTEKKETEEVNENLYELKSPMVGTFYTAPSPDADVYVKVGDSVKAGSVLCIIEAMKLMNEIESEVQGKIVKVMVQNAQPVEFNQTLFLIELTK
jgi:acetyl-CoA carboxylase biotin carboxyl carrier protein